VRVGDVRAKILKVEAQAMDPKTRRWANTVTVAGGVCALWVLVTGYRCVTLTGVLGVAFLVGLFIWQSQAKGKSTESRPGHQAASGEAAGIDGRANHPPK